MPLPTVSQSWQKAVRKKKVAVVNDNRLGKLDFKDLYPPKNENNIFKRVHEFIQEGIAYTDKFIPYEESEPMLKAVTTTERLGTVGGLEDTLRKVAVHHAEKSKAAMKWTKSPQFEELMETSKDATELFKKIVASKDIDKKAMLTEIEAKSVLSEASKVFTRMADKADIYLKQKMRERKVDNIRDLVGKNDYEQSHIDFAKSCMRFVDEYDKHIDGPANDREREEMMANYEHREIDMKKELWKEAEEKQVRKPEQAPGIV